MTDHGLFDIHCHLIPGVDDGAQDLEETRRLLRMEYEQGVRNFLITRICFKPDFPYINKLITEMLYLALTLSITTIRDLAVLNLRKKEKFIFDFALCLSIIILIFTAMLFGAMTVKDMGLLQEQISNNMNTSALLGITLIMDICNIVIGICVQVAASDN